MGNFVRDLHYTLRTLRKNPGFTVVAVIALALGIGVNTSIFSLYNALALRPLPVKDPGRVVRLFQTHAGESGEGVFSYPKYLDYRDRSSVLSGLAAWSWTSAAMGTGDRVEDVKAMLVSGNYFDVLGADTAAGRTFVPEEDRTPESHPVVVLSYGFWERRFARDPAIVGRAILLNGHPFTVVGVVRELDRNVQVSLKPMDENLEIWIWPSRVGATLAAAFGLLALTLAAVGIYGVVAYTVSRRTHEIGIHVALGAQRGDVLRMVMGHGMALVAAGGAAGLAAGFAVSRLLAGFLYGLPAVDPLTFGAVPAALAAVALMANYVPARRALRVDPMVALRYE